MAVETERVTLRLPVSDLHSIDHFIEAGEFMNRSDVIRAAIKDFVRSRAKEVAEGVDSRKILQDSAAKASEFEELKRAIADLQERLK